MNTAQDLFKQTCETCDSVTNIAVPDACLGYQKGLTCWKPSQLYLEYSQLQAENAEYRRCLEVLLSDAGHTLRPAIKEAIGLEYLALFKAQLDARDAVIEAARKYRDLVRNGGSISPSVFLNKLDEALQAYDEAVKP